MPFMLAITNDQLVVLMEVVSHMISCTHVILLLNQVKDLVTRMLKMAACTVSVVVIFTW